MGLVNLGWDLPDPATTLPARLRKSGYETCLFGFQHIVRDPSRVGYDRISECGNSCEAVAPVVAEFLQDRGDGDERPFYAEVGFSEVHRAYRHIDEVYAREDDVLPLPFLEDTQGLREDLTMFYADITAMDRAVGRILQALEEAGLAENTLVIFTTDHGEAFPRAKATLYDSGLRTSLIMRWPAGFPGERVLKPMVSNVDVLPTVLQAAAIEVPGDVEGRSFMPLLQNAKYESRHMVFAEKNTMPSDPKRCILTERYKYIRNYGDGAWYQAPTDVEVTRSASSLPRRYLEPAPEVELYDLAADPTEEENLAGKAAYSDVEEALGSELAGLMKRTGDPLLEGHVVRPEGEAARLRDIWDPEQMAARRARQEEIYRRYDRLRGQV
jgi:arylsulfatase A-like enzyme